MNTVGHVESAFLLRYTRIKLSKVYKIQTFIFSLPVRYQILGRNPQSRPSNVWGGTSFTTTLLEHEQRILPVLTHAIALLAKVMIRT